MIIEENKCTGCSACMNICPQKCITMEMNKEGFLFPFIDKEKCTNCGLCKKICPILNNNNEKSFEEIIAIKNKNKDIVENSSSGGLFYELAKYTLENEGYVVGAGYDDEFNVVHQMIDSVSDIPKLMTSKYVQSKIGCIYNEIKEKLKEEKNVLFTGTPCQIAGLKAFLRKDYSNLICVDLICHGAPSPGVFAKYRDYIKKNFLDEKEIKNINFRSKKVDWKRFSLQISSSDKTYSELLYNDSYMKGFLNNLYLRKSCHECIYKKYSSNSDITMADAWGIDEVNNSFFDSRGVSLALINTSKGKKLLENINDKFEITKFEYDDIKKYNSCVYKPSIMHKNRNKFFNEYGKNKNIKKIIDNCLDDGMIHKVKKVLKKIYSKFLEYRSYIIYFFKSFNVPFEVLDIEESLDYINKNKSSIIRFGDGELAIIEGANIGFQKKNDKLAKRLQEVLTSDIKGLEICIPGVFKSLNAHTKEAKKFWKMNLVSSRNKWYELCKNKKYLNAFVSRPYMEIKEKEKSARYFEKLKLIFKNKDVVLIEGKYSRLGVGNDLFDETKSLQRILCPTKNAFDKYEEILKEALKVSKKKIILLSLGPTAKVLAYDLFKEGYRVIDIGHIDLEYEWFLKKASKKEKISNKFVNEVNDNSDLTEINDEKYRKQIIKEI